MRDLICIFNLVHVSKLKWIYQKMRDLICIFFEVRANISLILLRSEDYSKFVISFASYF